MSVTTERSTPFRYSSTSVSRAMPTKTSRSLSLRMRTSPRMARAALSEPPKSTSALSETIAYARRGEVLARGHQEAVVVALGLVDHDEGRAAREQREREQRCDDSHDDEDDASGPASRTRRGLRRRRPGQRTAAQPELRIASGAVGASATAAAVPAGSSPPWSSRNGG